MNMLEKTRSDFRAREILSGLWELVLVFYMVVVVLKFSTSLILWVFAIDHVYRMSKFVQQARVFSKCWRLKMKIWAGLGLFAFDTLFSIFAPPGPISWIMIFLHFCFHFWLCYFISKHKKCLKNIFIIFYIYLAFYFNFSNIKSI